MKLFLSATMFIKMDVFGSTCFASGGNEGDLLNPLTFIIKTRYLKVTFSGGAFIAGKVTGLSVVPVVAVV